MKKILCLDFDGVLHSYGSGWKGATEIPDPPVPGALEFVVGALDHFRVVVLSSRSHQWGGRRAMKRWLRAHLINQGTPSWEFTPKWWQDRIGRTAFADPWADEVKHAADVVVGQIEWPKHKPPAALTIDDRAMRFVGVWPSLKAVGEFKPHKVNLSHNTVFGGDIP